MDAIISIPSGHSLSEEDVEGKALLIYSTSCFGRDEELARNRDASFKASEAQLRKLNDLCENLRLHIHKMNRQAVNGLYLEGCAIFTLEKELAATQEAAHQAFSELTAPERVAGAHSKIEAEQVGLQAGLIYEHVSGRRATYTSDPQTSEVRGPWVEFLDAVFSALGIDASAKAQAKALSRKLAQM